MWYFEEGGMVLWSGRCGTLKRVVWYFEEVLIIVYLIIPSIFLYFLLAGATELAIFHPVDTITKRLMTTTSIIHSLADFKASILSRSVYDGFGFAMVFSCFIKYIFKIGIGIYIEFELKYIFTLFRICHFMQWFLIIHIPKKLWILHLWVFI